MTIVVLSYKKTDAQQCLINTIHQMVKFKVTSKNPNQHRYMADTNNFTITGHTNARNFLLVGTLKDYNISAHFRLNLQHYC